MKNSGKKICLPAFVFALSLCLAACAASGQSSGQASSPVSSQTSSPSSASSSSTPEAASSTSAGTARESVLSMEDLTFPVGQQVSGEFTGNAYLEPMIMNDDIYHFPQTNNIVFEPGARSYWHSHGGMVIIGTGGSGYYQEEGKPAQIILYAPSFGGQWVYVPAGGRSNGVRYLQRPGLCLRDSQRRECSGSSGTPLCGV